MSKSFRQKDLDEQTEDIIQFVMNYVFPAFGVALLIGLAIGVHKCGHEEKTNQSVPVNKAVVVNTKQIDKKTTINYNDVKKLLANIGKSNFIKTK